MAGGRTPMALQYFIHTLLRQVHELGNKLKIDEPDSVAANDLSEEKAIFQLSLKQLEALRAPLQESGTLCERLAEDPKQALAAENQLWYLEHAVGRVAEFLAWLEKVEAEDADKASLLRSPVKEMEYSIDQAGEWLLGFRPIATEMRAACDSLKLAMEAEPEDESRPVPKPTSENSSSINRITTLILIAVAILLTGSWFVFRYSTCKCKETLVQVQEQCPVADASPASNLLSLESLCSFNCSSIQVQQAAMSFYLNKHREVQSVSILNSVPSGPWPNTCDVAFTWNRRLDAGGASGEDFRKFRFEEVSGHMCTYVPAAMGFHLTGHKAVDDGKLIFQGIGKCTGKVDVADSEAASNEGAAKWNGRGVWPVCRNGNKWSCVGGQYKDRYAHFEVPEWHGGGCKCATGCAEKWAEHEA